VILGQVAIPATVAEGGDEADIDCIFAWLFERGQERSRRWYESFWNSAEAHSLLFPGLRGLERIRHDRFRRAS